jgi:hypothetical protein
MIKTPSLEITLNQRRDPIYRVRRFIAPNVPYQQRNPLSNHAEPGQPLVYGTGNRKGYPARLACPAQFGYPFPEIHIGRETT